ncbi:MAG TPA: T9SS type A sorting domain-containing protein, partial [Flavobacteriales bacterium]|nr:T9SS type A sorting domain-containing protein [Flavobacteriales bacterium]
TGQALQIFPNPAEQLLTVVLPDAVQPYALEVLTIDGRLVAVHRVSRPIMDLNLTGLASGPYGIRVIDANGGEHHGRFFKQ